MLGVELNLGLDRQGTADILASSYEKLYCSSLDSADVHFELGEGNTTIPPFSRSDLMHKLHALKSGKARDQRGVFAELFKFGRPYLVDVLLDLYNQLISPNAVPLLE